MKKVLFWSAMLVLGLTFDHMMRVDQQSLCERGEVECPCGLWVW